MNAGPESPLRAEPEPPGWRFPLIIATLVGLTVLAGIIWLDHPQSERWEPVPAELPPPQGEAQEYLPHLHFGRMQLSRWRNFLGQEVLYLDFEVANRGPRTIRALKLTIEFHDQLQDVVLRETVRPVGRPEPLPGGIGGPLEPNQTRTVRVGFEHLPADWNRQPPRVSVTGLLLD